MNIALTLTASSLVIASLIGCKTKDPSENPPPPSVAEISQERPLYEVGDVVFTRAKGPLFTQVARATNCWTSHVGVIVCATPGAEIVAESTLPFSKLTPLSKFVGRSVNGAYAVKRPVTPLTEEQKRLICAEAQERLGILYHPGFKYGSKRQFCSKFVYDVFKDACDREIGKMETYDDLIHAYPEAPKSFWYVWYGGFIPWDRATVTPASQYRSDALYTVYDNHEDLLTSL